MSNWRPKDWDYTYKAIAKKLPIFDPASLCDPTIFEAGADAMLKAISEEIEKAKNHLSAAGYAFYCVEDFRKRILSLLKEE